MIGENRPNTCLAGARVSSARQASGESLADQVRALKQTAQQRGLAVLPDGEVAIEVYTATKRRPVYEKHLRYIEANPGKVGYYLIRYIDRFTREGAQMYEQMKKELAQLGVALIDTYGIIQPTRNMPELENLGFAYDWGFESPSELAEVMVATTAKHEREAILRRTIPKAILYTQQGYQIGQPDDGYKNEFVWVGSKKRCIQARDPERAPFVEKMFSLRAEGKHTDVQIAEILNEQMGFRTKTQNRWNREHTEIIGTLGGNKLHRKALQRYCRRFSYAGVICEKWTHNKPVKAQWKPLVSIELFNAANRGKVFIKEGVNDQIEILYDYQREKPSFKHLRHNPDFPFKCVACPICAKPFKGSAPAGRNGRKYPRYHCERGHKLYTVTRTEMDQTIDRYFDQVRFDDTYLKILKDVLSDELRRRQADAVRQACKQRQRIASLKSERSRTLTAHVKTESDTVRGLLEEKLEEIASDLKNAEAVGFNADLTEADINELNGFINHIVENPKKTLIDRENPLRQKRLFELFFDGLPNYEKLKSGTAKMRFIFNIKCLKEARKNGQRSGRRANCPSGGTTIHEEAFQWLEKARECFGKPPFA